MRIVSLCPSLTELVFDLGCSHALVGRTKFCVHPVGQVERIEAVGGTKNPKITRIIELAPDLVLLNEEENRREDAEALLAAGIQCDVTFPRTVKETADTVRHIGALLGRRDAAQRIASDIEQRAERVRTRANQASPVRYAYVIWRNPWMVAGRDTFVTAMLSLAGGKNVFADHPDRYPSITIDDIVASRPDTVFLSSEPFPFTERHANELAASGISRERIQFVDGEYLSWHGSRTPRGIDYAEWVIDQARDTASTSAP